MKAVGYFRELGPQRPLAEQTQSFLDFCRREGYEAVATFFDWESGDGRGHPPGFRSLLDYLRRPDRGFLVVVVPCLECLGPAPAAARAYFALDSLGGKVVFLDGAGDPAGELLARWSVERGGRELAERVRAGMRRRAIRGEVLGRPPFGYRVGPHRRLEVVAEEGALVRYIFRLYLREGLGIRRITGRLNEEGYQTRRGGRWSMVSIRDILRNRTYLGTYARFGVRVPGSHPALVSAEDFRLVQERMGARRSTGAQRRASLFLLSSLAYCGACGNRMIGVSRRQRWQRRGGEEREALYRYYQCESRTNQSVCEYRTRRAAELEEEVRAVLAGEHPSAAARRSAAGDEPGLRASVEGERRRLKGRLRRLERRLQEALGQAAQGHLPRERLRAASETLTAERLEVEERLAELEQRARSYAAEAEQRQRRQQARQELVAGWGELAERRKQELLREVVDRVVVRDGRTEVLLLP